jgi:hypothetical protein
VWLTRPYLNTKALTLINIDRSFKQPQYNLMHDDGLICSAVLMYGLCQHNFSWKF